MIFLAQAAPAVEPQGAFSPTVVGIITALSAAVSAVVVAYINSQGNKRTSKTDRIPDVVEILQAQIRDVKDDRDRQVQKVEEERDRWRDLAWRAFQKAEDDTVDSFDTDDTKT